MRKHPLSFEFADLPPEGVVLKGEVSFAELDIEEEERLRLPNPVRYELRLTPVTGNGILLRGRIRSEIVRTCDRCERDAPAAVAVDDVCHEYEDAFGRELDLTEDIREDILLALPSRFLCREDCRGLCPVCGRNLNDGPCGCAEGGPAGAGAAGPFGSLDGLGL